MFNNKLLLLSGNDIPFVGGQLVIHQPRIREIGYIGEDAFYTGCEYLNFSKDNLSQQDKNHLGYLSDFEVLMTMIRTNDTLMQKNKVCVEMVLLLLFPTYKITFLPIGIMLQNEDEKRFINRDNFEEFKQILNAMFYLSQFLKGSKQYNPGGPQAKALVQKFKKRRQKLAEMKNKGRKQGESISILSRYISILSVGQHKDKNQLLQYTVYQLTDQFKRFKQKEEYDLYIKLQLAGAQNVETVENWMEDLELLQK